MAITMGVKVDEEIRNRLKLLGESKRRSPHWLMKEAICKYLDHEEELERRNQEAGESWQQYQKTGEFVSNKDMVAWLDTWGTNKEKQCPKITK